MMILHIFVYSSAKAVTKNHPPAPRVKSGKEKIMDEIIVLNWLAGAMMTCCKLLAACGIIWFLLSLFLNLCETPAARRDRKVREAILEYEIAMQRSRELLKQSRMDLSHHARRPSLVVRNRRIP